MPSTSAMRSVLRASSTKRPTTSRRNSLSTPCFQITSSFMAVALHSSISAGVTAGSSIGFLDRAAGLLVEFVGREDQRNVRARRSVIALRPNPLSSRTAEAIGDRISAAAALKSTSLSSADLAFRLFHWRGWCASSRAGRARAWSSRHSSSAGDLGVVGCMDIVTPVLSFACLSDLALFAARSCVASRASTSGRVGAMVCRRAPGRTKPRRHFPSLSLRSDIFRGKGPQAGRRGTRRLRRAC